MSRRAVLGTGAALGAALPLTGLGTSTAQADEEHHRSGQRSASVRAAVSFLQQATDAYRDHGFRLAQSYQDASGLKDIAFVYDNALTSLALLSVGDMTRARAIGDALLYAQNHDAEFTDHRLRQAYHADVFTDPAGVAISGYDFGLVGTAVGDMAWSGIALARLARKTRHRAYLTGAVQIGQWIFDNTYSTSGLGGYTFGETANLRDHKSTEHNIDVYGFFRLLAELTGDRVWRTRARHAWEFVEAVWNAAEGFFWTGSDDGATINKNPLQLPEDPQTWSWLAARDRDHAGSVDWAAGNLATTELSPHRQLQGRRGRVRQRVVPDRYRRQHRRAELEPQTRQCSGLVRRNGAPRARPAEPRPAARRRGRGLAAEPAQVRAAPPRKGPDLRRQARLGRDRRRLLADGHRFRLRLLPEPAHRRHRLVRLRRHRLQPLPLTGPLLRPSGGVSQRTRPVGGSRRRWSACFRRAARSRSRRNRAASTAS
jgi:hypothetical protein